MSELVLQRVQSWLYSRAYIMEAHGIAAIAIDRGGTMVCSRFRPWPWTPMDPLLEPFRDVMSIRHSKRNPLRIAHIPFRTVGK